MNSSNNNQSHQVVTAKEGSTIQNIIQAVIHLPAWAWVLGVVVASIGLCCSVISGVFLYHPQPWLPPTSTPVAFATATANESLIIVADFDDQSGGVYMGVNPAQRIYDKLNDQIQKDNLNINIQHLHQIANDNTARSIGKYYNATMVVWGWYDAYTITPRIERIKLLKGSISNQENLQFIMSDPEKVEFSVVTDLPAQANYLVMFTLGIDKYSNNQFDDALSYFDHAIEAATSDTGTSVNPSEAYYYHGSSYYYKGNTSLASADFSRALELNQNNIDAHKGRMHINFLIGQLDLVIADCNIILELDANDAETYINRGAAYSRKGDYDRAIADFDKAIELDPNLAPIFYYNRGVVYANRGDYDDAIADFDKAIELNPNQRDGYLNRGRSYNYKGDYDRAIADYDKAIELEPDNSEAYNSRGIAYDNKGDSDRAIADYDKAIELNPNDAKLYNNRCWSFYDMGEYDKALSDCEKAVTLDPNNDHLWCARGFVYEALGRKDDAIKDFEYILEYSTDPTLRKYAEVELQKLRDNSQ
jgi:tetratricopeptide (TPR) repeat protein